MGAEAAQLAGDHERDQYRFLLTGEAVHMLNERLRTGLSQREAGHLANTTARFAVAKEAKREQREREEERIMFVMVAWAVLWLGVFVTATVFLA